MASTSRAQLFNGSANNSESQPSESKKNKNLPVLLKYDSDGEEDDSGEFYKPSKYLTSADDDAERRDLCLYPYGDHYYNSDTVECLELKLVRNAEEIDDTTNSFSPEMTYAVFGQSEHVVGYHGLQIRMYYCAGNLAPYVDIAYKEKAINYGKNGIQNENIFKLIDEHMKAGYYKKMSTFKEALEKDKLFKPYGEKINNIQCMGVEEETIDFDIYQVTIKSCKNFAKYLERFQTFLLWYIEAASFVDLDDEKWRFFVAYEKYTDGESTRYAIAGFISVYEFYSHPNNIRPRVSQMLVLPPFQGAGLGAKLLQTVFDYYRKSSNVTDITVESPTGSFQRLRDYIDCLAAESLDCFSKENLSKPFNSDIIKETNEKLKMNKKQALRVYNILRLRNINKDNKKEMNAYINSLKKQQDKTHQAEVARAKRKHLFEKLNFKDILAAMPSLNEDYHESVLSKATNSMMEHYTRVIERLDKN